MRVRRAPRASTGDMEMQRRISTGGGGLPGAAGAVPFGRASVNHTAGVGGGRQGQGQGQGPTDLGYGSDAGWGIGQKMAQGKAVQVDIRLTLV